MINPKHPLEFYNTQQEFFLQLIPEADMEYHTLKISYSNAVYLYYNLQLNVSIYDYKEWLNGIKNEKLKREMESEGFEKCRQNYLFLQFIQNKRNIRENDYIRDKMGNEEYIRYKELCI
jgi:hypothetical protein